MKWYAKPVPAKVQHADTHSARYFEDRDPRGVIVHWSWLHRHWEDLADKLVDQEQRGMFR